MHAYSLITIFINFFHSNELKKALNSHQIIVFYAKEENNYLITLFCKNIALHFFLKTSVIFLN